MAEDDEQAETETNDNDHRRHVSEHASSKHERHPVSADTVPATDDADAGTDKPATSDDDEAPNPTPAPSEPDKMKPHHRVWQWLMSHKKVSIPAAVVLLLVMLFAVPVTRYALAGTIIRKDFSVLVVDAQTHKPISSAQVVVGGVTTITNNKGVASVHTKVGNTSVVVAKKYYASSSKAVLVPLGSQKQRQQITLAATGRQVPVTITNKITGQPVANVAIIAQGTEAKTDAKGEVVLVVPANKSTVQATLKGTAYNTQKVTIKVTASVDAANKFQVTPAGKLYFLSNKSGVLDVVKANLDGTERQTVLAGTGKEDKNNTVLLASQDWQYLALLSKRDGGDRAKLFLIDTSNDSLSTMDEGNATFTMVGWSGHRFIYSVNREGYQQWQANAQALKSFDASNGKTAILDQTAAGGNASGYFNETIGNVFIYSGDEVVYTKNVNANNGHDATGHDATLNSVKANGDDKKAIKSWSYKIPGDPPYYGFVGINVAARTYGPNQIYVAGTIYIDAAIKDDNLYEYEGGKLETVSGKKANNIYDGDYATYLLSPSDSKTFWAEARDGKNTLFVGDDEGKSPKEIASLTEYQPYGWYTEKYVLASKGGSELYIMPASGGTPLKITDYYKPFVSFTGYGKGYGGL